MLRTILMAVVLAAAVHCGARAEALQYTTTWLGNSFGGGEKWVQNFVDGMFVAPNGTVYLASGWDEACREFGIYRNGDAVGNCADTHGWGTNGGPAVAASETYLFIAHSHGNEGGHLKGPQYPPKGFEWFGISRRHLDGSHAKFPGGKGRFGDLLVLHEADPKSGAHVRGLAADGKNRLYASDAHAGEIKVFDAETMALAASWKLPRPRQLAFYSSRGLPRPREGKEEGTENTLPRAPKPAGGGEAQKPAGGEDSLWVLQAGDGAEPPRVLRFSPDGQPLPQQIAFEKGVVPTALCIDRKTGHLLVTDNGPAQQVLIYSDLDASPKLSGTFGERGGIYAGPTPGLVGPKRFSGPMGVGTDAAGNLYVGCNQPAGGTILRAFSPTGDVLWELLGIEFVDAADTDPATDGADVFTTENRYALDWSKPGPGRQWTWRSQTVDPFRYPNDPRLHENHHDFTDPLFRRLNGKPFLFIRGMFQHMLVIYRLDGEIAVPCGMFAKGPYHVGPWTPPGQPEKGRWIWRDLNGDGDFQPNEFLEADGVREPESWAWWVDDRGDIWQGDQTGKEPIRHYPFQGFDERGNPVYSRAASRTFPLPAPMNHLLRIEYHPAADTMFLTGHTADRPKRSNEWGQVGTEILRFDAWSRGNRTPLWRIVLPYDPEKGVTVKSFCTAGDYVFAVECRTARVHVFDARTGAKVGEIMPGPEVARESGWVDFPDALRVFRRANGEYLLFVEEDAKGKIIIYRWQPAAP